MLAFAVYLALARVLAPEAFGLVALAGVVVAFLQIFVTQSFGVALVQRKDLTDTHLDTGFWISLASGSGLFGLLWLLAGPIARAAGQPEIAPVLVWLALSLPINALANVPTAVLMRDMRFKPLALRSTASVIVGGIAGVAMAIAGFGVWSLVGQQLVGAAVGVAALWTATDWRPGRNVSRACFNDLAGFSAGVLGNNILWFFSQRLDHLIIGVGLGPVALGVYFIAFRLVSLVLDLLTSPLQSVALPWFSQKQDDRPGLRAAYTRGTRLASLSMFPLFVGLWAVGDIVTPLVFGAKWIESGPIVAALAIAAAVRAAQTFVNPAMLAVGRPGLYLAILAGHVAWTAAAMAIAFPWGALGVAWAVGVASAITGVVNAVALRSLLDFRLREQFTIVAGPAIAAGLMGVGVRAIVLNMPASVPDLVTTIAAVLAGAAMYAALALIFCRTAVRDALDVALGVAGRSARDADRETAPSASSPDHAGATGEPTLATAP